MSGPIDIRVRLSAQPFSPEAETASLFGTAGDAGGIVIFTGLVRGEDGVTALELQHHPTFTLKVMWAMADEVARRWPLTALHAVHRVGRMAPGEAIVFVGAGARHRRDAFEAADRLMDGLKTNAPFWKREHRGPDMRWIAPRAADHADEARWMTAIS